MRSTKQAIDMLHSHVASAIDLQERANEAKLGQLAVQAEEWQGMMLQRVIDMLDNSPDEELPGIVSSRQSYLDPIVVIEDADEIRRALTMIGERTLLDMDLRDPNTAFVLGQVSRAAGKALLKM